MPEQVWTRLKPDHAQTEIREKVILCKMKFKTGESPYNVYIDIEYALANDKILHEELSFLYSY